MAQGRKTGGRQAGTPNRATADVRDAAQRFTQDALETLADIMADVAQPAAARVSAATALLDRGHGKPRQPLTGDDGSPPLLSPKLDLSGLTEEQLRALAAIPVR